MLCIHQSYEKYPTDYEFTLMVCLMEQVKKHCADSSSKIMKYIDRYPSILRKQPLGCDVLSF